MSGWVRYNLLRGFAHIPFAKCREFWGLKILHIKPQRIYTEEQNILLNRITSSEDQQRKLMLKHTTLTQWALSSHDPISSSAKFEPANLEQRAFAFDMSWKFCPICCAEDLHNHGFSFWHRNHQLSSVTQCDLHGDDLLSSPNLATFDRLVLPHTIPSIERSSLKPAVNSQELHNWNSFIFTIDHLATTNIDLINQWKNHVYKIIRFPPMVQQKHLQEILETSKVLDSELGPLIMNHIFRNYGKKGAKDPRILDRLFPGSTYRQSKTHPIYWTLLLYWAYQHSKLSGFSLNDYPNTP
jgi:hypothetical protein